MKSIKIKIIIWKSIVIIICFLLLYFLYLNLAYIMPNEFEISIVILLGLAIIIIVVFYFFIKFDSPNNNIIQIKILNENAIKIILIVLMSITIFIPAVSFSDVIISWDHIHPLNYVRCVVFLIGALFIPGACIFNLIPPESTIHERLNVESFFVKLTIYPIISLTYLGSLTLILDFLDFTRFSIFLFLFSSILFLFVLDQIRNANKLKIKTTEITISRYTFLILIMGIGLIIVGFGVILSSSYLLPGDRWRPISSSLLVGVPDISPFTSFVAYPRYWGIIIFSLSVLCGIPYINTNVLLFLFLYLSFTSIYLFTKALLNNKNSKFCFLSSIFIAILFHPTELIYQFSFHSFAFYSFFLSLTFFFIVIKSDDLKNSAYLKRGNIVMLALSSIFLVQSLITYYIPGLIGLITIFLYCIFSENIKHYLRDLLIFYGFFIIFFSIIDFMSYFCFSYDCIMFLSNFSGIPLSFSQISPRALRYFLGALIFYPILFSSLILLLIVYKFSRHFSIIIKKVKLKINTILEKRFFVYLLFFFILIFISLSLCLLIANDLTFLAKFLVIGWALNREEYFFIYYLSLLFCTMGFIGILGIYLSYFCFKENKKLFFFLFSWTVLLICVASSVLFLKWIQYPTSLVSEIPSDDYTIMIYWYSRTWSYSIIPLSIFASIGLIKLIQEVKSRGWFKVKSRGWFQAKTYNDIKSLTSLSLISLLIFLSFSNPITLVMYWDNFYSVSDEEAQIIGWTTKNVRGSTILISKNWWKLGSRFQQDLYHYSINYFEYELENAVENYRLREEDFYKWRTNDSDVQLLYEKDEFNNVILMYDKNPSGGVSMVKDFIGPQSNGTISFYLKMSTADEDIDAGIVLRIFGRNSSEGIDFYMNHGNHYYYNDSNNKYDDMDKEYGVNEWNYYEINFECKNPGYWNVSMNGVQINNNISGESKLELRGEPANFSRFEISTTNEGKEYYVYFYDFSYSWETNTPENGLYKRILLNDITKLIYHLNSEDIHYFLIYRQYIYRYPELMEYFYRKELYSYGNLSIYGSIQL